MKLASAEQSTNNSFNSRCPVAILAQAQVITVPPRARPIAVAPKMPGGFAFKVKGFKWFGDRPMGCDQDVCRRWHYVQSAIVCIRGTKYRTVYQRYWNADVKWMENGEIYTDTVQFGNLPVAERTDLIELPDGDLTWFQWAQPDEQEFETCCNLLPRKRKFETTLLRAGVIDLD